ncbi:MAG: adenylate/guanylate cyclase domain-containing protein [Cytophagales bacterium]
MFRTFRQRLLFWFMVFISSNLIIILLVFIYLDRRQVIEDTSEIIQLAHIQWLKYTKSQEDFLTFDTKQEEFFQSNLSFNLQKCEIFLDSTNIFIDSALTRSEGQFEFTEELKEFKKEARFVDSLFNHLVGLIYIRGYKDFNVIGEIREDAHWLENSQELSDATVLLFRKHEKDYIIRNENIYVQRFNYLIDELIIDISNRNIPDTRKDSVLIKIRSYERHFNELVDLDNTIGINTNSGIKYSLDTQIDNMENHINQIVRETENRKKALFYNLNIYFGVIVSALILISLITSYFISQQITNPLKKLTLYIGKFVESDFTLEEEYPLTKSHDEVGILSKNFKVLKDEVISSIKFFKEKVAERTLELANANEKLRAVNQSNKRFVPDNFLKLLGKESIEQIGLGDQTESDMTVMFTDIRSFTKISENLSPQENLDFINAYLKEIVPVIQSHGGFIDKYIGDSIMALFPENPESAIESALEFKEAIIHFNQTLNAKGMDGIRIGTGIHTGHLILGTVGTEKRLDTTVISDAVNLSSRIEGLTKVYGVECIITDESIMYIKDKKQFHFRFLDYVKVKGRSNPISVYEILQKDDLNKIQSKDFYEEGVNCYFNRDFKAASKIFEKIIMKYPNDVPSKVYFDRCTQLIERGTTEGWDFIQNITEK